MSRAKTILMVDDVAMFRELGEVFLARSGRVITAADGGEALERVRSDRPDLVISDLHMPELDGEGLCRAIKADPDLQHTPFIMTIGSEGADDSGRAVRAGADDLLFKPLSRSGLVETVNRFLLYEDVRGLPRVPVYQPVEVTCEDHTSWGTLRNLSRGGAFVETERDLEHAAEVDLRFAIPETKRQVQPSAQVIWQRPPNGAKPGFGMRFVAVERREASWLDDFVWEHRMETGGTPQARVASEAR